jgi:hypothetical protein
LLLANKWLVESKVHLLVDVEYDSKGALTAEDLEQALHDYHRWYHQTDKLESTVVGGDSV